MCREAGDGPYPRRLARVRRGIAVSLLGSFRSEQLIQQLVAEKDPTSSGARRLVGKIKKIGPKVIPKVIDALAMSDKSHTMVFVDILSALVNDKTLEYYLSLIHI